jgi:hypothetical protein
LCGILRIFKAKLLMYSGVYVTIRLDKFYQDFLRSYFSCNDLIFSFPRGEELSFRLVRLMKKPPEGYIPGKNMSNGFHVSIPKDDDKDPYSFNYLSERGQIIFIEHVRKLYEMVFHESMNKYLHEGFEKKECLEIFIDQYDLSCNYIDRITKDYQRYVHRKICQKYRKKNTSKMRNLSAA